MSFKPSIPKGTRDFSPVETARRNYIFDTIQTIFKRYGFEPIETPVMENLTTLMGKYGEEGDKLLFKILNSGDFTRAVDMKEKDSLKLGTQICEKGLRYDLTVPFARYVVQHRGEIVFPFKRYQIQPVWRADRPQKGRYREFYQCDVDVIGTESLLCEAELVKIVEDVFSALRIGVVLRVNNRKILYGIAQTIGHADKMIDITIAIDKLDKIGVDAVSKELIERGLSCEDVAMLIPILELKGSNNDRLDALDDIFCDSEIGRLGVQEIRTLLDYTSQFGSKLNIELDLSLARGLNYYTGAIFEVKATEFEIGSISGGGRYDNLTGTFGVEGMSGVGISFGADRIYDVMLGLGLFMAETTRTVRAMFVNFGDPAQLPVILKLLGDLRDKDVSSELYPDSVKLKKQFDYAVRREIPYMIFVGENEIKDQKATIKNIISGEQTAVDFHEIANFPFHES